MPDKNRMKLFDRNWENMCALVSKSFTADIQKQCLKLIFSEWHCLSDNWILV